MTLKKMLPRTVALAGLDRIGAVVRHKLFSKVGSSQCFGKRRDQSAQGEEKEEPPIVVVKVASFPAEMYDGVDWKRLECTIEQSRKKALESGVAVAEVIVRGKKRETIRIRPNNQVERLTKSGWSNGLG